VIQNQTAVQSVVHIRRNNYTS